MHMHIQRSYVAWRHCFLRADWVGGHLVGFLVSVYRPMKSHLLRELTRGIQKIGELAWSFGDSCAKGNAHAYFAIFVFVHSCTICPCSTCICWLESCGATRSYGERSISMFAGTHWKSGRTLMNIFTTVLRI